MPAIKYDFEIEQGADFSLAFRRKGDDGDPIPLTGFTARMQVRANVASNTVLLELTTENERLVIDENDGRVTIALDAETTAAVNWRRGVYDLELVSPGGSVTRLVEGAITVSKEVTR